MIKGKIIQSDTSIKASILGYTPTKATEEKMGLIRIATKDEAMEGKSDTTAITPSTLKNVIDDLGVVDSKFTFEQNIASDEWTINHNLHKKPSITVVDSADNVVIGEENYIDENNLTIKFNSKFKGKAYLN
jgi:ribosome-interacting GTPase 1